MWYHAPEGLLINLHLKWGLPTSDILVTHAGGMGWGGRGWYNIYHADIFSKKDYRMAYNFDEAFYVAYDSSRIEPTGVTLDKKTFILDKGKSGKLQLTELLINV